MNGRERRKRKRYSAQLPVTLEGLEGGEGTLRTQTANVSASGLCVKLATEIPMLSSIGVRLELPAEWSELPRELACSGVVVWTDATVEAEGRPVHYCGIAFINDDMVLEERLAERLELTYVDLVT
ncbi:MAG: PilZ domain-containing protein [Candidatus Schekmanbacteria bacterium]|nr:PilZ domain-containing protein [Candidatus Schekmanbacteria bacterium]